MTVRIERGQMAIADAASLELRGAALVVARLVWATLILVLVALFSTALPAQYQQLSSPPADVRAQLVHAGISARAYATYLTTIGTGFAVLCVAVAALIVRHRPADRIGLFASLYLVLMGLASPPQLQAVVWAHPQLSLAANLVSFAYSVQLLLFFFLFPDGRFVPSWSRVPVSGALLGCTVVFFATGASIVVDPPGWLGMTMLVGGLAGIAAQVYRYRRVSDLSQRQQTKWVALGAGFAIVVGMVAAFAGPHIPTIGRTDTSYDLTSVTMNTLASTFVPLTLGFAMLRYRLWEIDLVINRTLVYGTLTVSLAALYLLVIYGLGAVFQARGDLPLSLLATALVAALFAPLRARVQTAINRLLYGERDDPYRVLTRLGERVRTTREPDAVLPAIAETVAGALKSPYAAITLGSDATADIPGGLSLPVEYQGEAVGQLLVAPRSSSERFSNADHRLLRDLARQIGPAVHAVRLATDLQRSRENLVTAREEERRRLRRDLHDGLGPQLAALTLRLETIRNRFGTDGALDAALVEATAQTQDALTDIRRLVYALRPPALDELGLVPALRQSAGQYSNQGPGQLQVTVDVPEPLPPLSAAVEVATYRIVQEALANVARHAEAQRCLVRLCWEAETGALGIRVEDDGRGQPEEARAGVGLLSMRERAEELGGRCDIGPAEAGGTLVSVSLPCLAGPGSPAAHQ